MVSISEKVPNLSLLGSKWCCHSFIRRALFFLLRDLSGFNKASCLWCRLGLGSFLSSYLQARVTIQNYHQYRHVEKPGWKLGWTWAKEEFIWSISGAVATKQGDCKPSTEQKPHCCSPNPVVVDLTPDATTGNTTDGCCRGGLLAAWAINPSMSYSSFEITVGNLDQNRTGYLAPLNLTLMAPRPGYTCGPVRDARPTVETVVGGRREEQVFSKYFHVVTPNSKNEK